MNDTILTENYKDYTIKIVLDNDTVNPITEWDNFGKMVCYHKNYILGDKNYLYNYDNLIKFLKAKKAIYLPLYLYDHSGITIKTSPFSCQWDSGQVGYIYVLPDDVYKEYSCKRITKKIRDKVINLLQSEVEVYDKYLTGEVYGYQIIDSDDEIIDSVYGYYIEPDELLKECKQTIDYIDSKQDKQLQLI